jgi:hypothetical protein
MEHFQSSEAGSKSIRTGHATLRWNICQSAGTTGCHNSFTGLYAAW